ncbi:CorA family divalent cation transporter [Dehalogenimonas etheniformans]|uniref:Magnesium transporter CorA n=1 Tax=Dehalogenimonas etheniformans TaxID=1536648 RepID=A0A2P5P932_9CHLR|nr:CorA family divalent cation transporter [Dehalogenimonas etheniformans]PPD58811.1 magnesium transporter CorA [Dehalogenimonas etheniformans]QNT76420.1 magnesium transporter CorA [Dehalogenimonas etheniformans]
MAETFITDALPPKRWFCVALQPDGTASMSNSDFSQNFQDMLKNAVIAWVDFRTDEFEKDFLKSTEFGFSKTLLNALTQSPRDMYEDFNTEMGVKLPSIQIRLDQEPSVRAHTTLLLMKKRLILTVHPIEVDRRYARLRRYSDTVLKKLPKGKSDQDLLTFLMMRLIETNNDRNFEHLRQIEAHGDELNRSLMDPTTSRNLLGPQIYRMKHALISYLDALWESVDVIKDLRYGDADLITDDQQILERVGLLADDVNRQIGLSEHLSEVLASGLEVLQSIYNNQLQVVNNRLALAVTYFTVFGTALLVPNTIATVLGNSAFDMGSGDIWWFLLLLILTTVAATMFTFWWVKKMGMLPKKLD